jgi:hypothetical protein
MIAITVTTAAALAQVPMTTATANLASFTGTYTFQMAQLKDYSVESNMKGQQVGFCNGNGPVGYNCWDYYTFDLLVGTLVSDGAGHITSGTFSSTRDPNSYQCSPKQNPTSPCPVIVPSGKAYSATTAYNVGAVVDYTSNGTTRTFQAVQKSTGKTPNWNNTTTVGNICTYNNLSTCFWTQIPASLTASDSDSTGTITGTYTIQSNGSGVLTLTPSNCNDCGQAKFAINMSPASQVGQTVGLVGMSQLGNHNRDVGTAVRIK